MNCHIFESEQKLISAFANYFIEKANFYIKSNGVFNVVLSGGNSPKKVYEFLASPEFRNKVEWSKIYFFFGDERHVPANDERNNGLMAYNVLFQPLKISIDHIFKINTSLPPVACANDYKETLEEYFKSKPIRFDLIMLGLGDNSHTASLFPFTAVLKEKKATVSEVFLKEENAFRITLTAPLINQAKNIAFLVFGKSKAAAVQHIITGEKQPEKFPAQLIEPENGELHWFLDKAAAGLIE